MSTFLSSSRRALQASWTGTLLDVLAPAAFSALSLHSPRRSASSSSKSSSSTPSTSNVRLEDSSPRKASRRPSTKNKELVEPRPKPNRPQRGRPPSPRAPSAVDLLSKIRNAPSSPTSSSSDPAVQHHNQAVLNVVHGTAGARRDFDRSFKQGWIPIRNTGQVGRLNGKDLVKVLKACSLMFRDGKTAPGEYDWREVRELVLWLAGEKDMQGLVEWAWSTIEMGVEGCEKVIDVWEAIARGEHLALRQGDKAINRSYRRTELLDSLSPPSSPPKPPAFLFSAYIAAKSVTHRHLSDQPSFTSLLPFLLNPAYPVVYRWLNHPDADKWLNRAFSTVHHSNDPKALSSAIAWLRQVSLAQIWYEQRDLPGLALVKHVRATFQRSAHKQVWSLWCSINEAIDNPEFGWISVDDWDRSARQRWVSREGVQALDAEVEREERKSDASPLQDSTAPTNDLFSLSQDSSADSPSTSSSRITPALLTQAIVHPFLAGFVRAQLLPQANQVWAWLASHNPPLNPGVVTWTGLLSGYAQRGDFDAVESAWTDMIRGGIVPNLWVWLVRIEAYFQAKRPDEAISLAKSMMKDQEVVREVEREHGGRFPEIVWDKLVSGLMANGRREEAEAFLDDMEASGSPPTIHTVNLLLKYYTRGKNPDLPAVVRMLRLISDKKLDADVFTFTMVLVALLAGGQKDATAKTIEIMEATRVKPTVTTYGAIIHSLANSGQPEHLTAAVQLLDEMEGRKMETNEIIYTSLIQGFLRAIPTTPLRSLVVSENEDGQHPYFNAAMTLKNRMERRGIQMNRVGYNAFIGAALALQSDWGVDLALRSFKEMKRRPGFMSSTSNDGGGAGGDDLRNEDYASEVHRQGRAVTVADTWFVLLSGFMNMKDWGRARAIVSEMEKSGFQVRNRGLQRLVDRITGGGGGLART